jgi:hypothetical protein
MSDMVGIASPSKYNSFISLETVLYFVCDDVTVGIHALINGHEYHCVAIRMRCWLMDA